MDNQKNIEFQDNNAANEHYICVQISTEKALDSWRESVFSFQWLNAKGQIRPIDELPVEEQPKRRAVEKAINDGDALMKPVLGIGMQDNIEIGSGRAVFLTLIDLGYDTMPVHILRSNETEFKSFIADKT